MPLEDVQFQWILTDHWTGGFYHVVLSCVNIAYHITWSGGLLPCVQLVLSLSLSQHL